MQRLPLVVPDVRVHRPHLPGPGLRLSGRAIAPLAVHRDGDGDSQPGDSLATGACKHDLGYWGQWRSTGGTGNEGDTMRSPRASALALACVGLVGVGVGAAFAPAAASAAAMGTQAVTSGVTSLRNALAGLVKDGTLTQAQADKVASALERSRPERGSGGHGRRHLDLDTAASVIGVTTDELHTALENGKTLAQVAQSRGISQATLVDRLVATQTARIAAAVKAGRLTQAQADARTAALRARITERVTTARPAGGRGHRGLDSHGRGPNLGSTPSTP